MQNSYLSLDVDAQTAGGIPSWKASTRRRASSTVRYRLDVTPTMPFPSPVTLIPTYPDLPMEDVYPRVAHTETRELYLRQAGKGRVAYVPWDIDRAFWEVLSPDHGRLLRNVVTWALDEPSRRRGSKGRVFWTSACGDSRRLGYRASLSISRIR
jgi:hypothetical protein